MPTQTMVYDTAAQTHQVAAGFTLPWWEKEYADYCVKCELVGSGVGGDPYIIIIMTKNQPCPFK